MGRSKTSKRIKTSSIIGCKHIKEWICYPTNTVGTATCCECKQEIALSTLINTSMEQVFNLLRGKK